MGKNGLACGKKNPHLNKEYKDCYRGVKLLGPYAEFHLPWKLDVGAGNDITPRWTVFQ